MHTTLVLDHSIGNHVTKQSPTGILHRSSKRPALGLCAFAEPWEPSVRCPALPSTAPATTQHPQYAPVIALHQKQPNSNQLYS